MTIVAGNHIQYVGNSKPMASEVELKDFPQGANVVNIEYEKPYLIVWYVIHRN